MKIDIIRQKPESGLTFYYVGILLFTYSIHPSAYLSLYDLINYVEATAA